MSVNERARQLMGWLGYSNNELESLSGVSTQVWSKIRTGRQNAGSEHLSVLARLAPELTSWLVMGDVPAEGVIQKIPGDSVGWLILDWVDPRFLRQLILADWALRRLVLIVTPDDEPGLVSETWGLIEIEAEFSGMKMAIGIKSGHLNFAEGSRAALAALRNGLAERSAGLIQTATICMTPKKPYLEAANRWRPVIYEQDLSRDVDDVTRVKFEAWLAGAS